MPTASNDDDVTPRAALVTGDDRTEGEADVEYDPTIWSGSKPGEPDEAALAGLSAATDGRGAIDPTQAFDAEGLDPGRARIALAGWFLLPALADRRRPQPARATRRRCRCGAPSGGLGRMGDPLDVVAAAGAAEQAAQTGHGPGTAGRRGHGRADGDRGPAARPQAGAEVGRSAEEHAEVVDEAVAVDSGLLDAGARHQASELARHQRRVADRPNQTFAHTRAIGSSPNVGWLWSPERPFPSHIRNRAPGDAGLHGTPS